MKHMLKTRKRTFTPSKLSTDRQKFRRHLDRARLSQNALAKRMGFEHKQTLSKILSGERRMIVDEFVEMVRALGTSPNELLDTLGFNILSRTTKITAELTAEGLLENYSSNFGIDVHAPVNAGEIGEVVFVSIDKGPKTYLFGSTIFTELWRTPGLHDALRPALIDVPKIGERLLGTIFPLRAGQIVIRNIITDEEFTTSGRLEIAPVIDWRFS